MAASRSSSQKAQNSASMGGSRGPTGGSLSAPVRTAPSSGAGAGGASSGRTSTGGASRSPGGGSKAPTGGSMGGIGSKGSTAKAPSSSPKTGSGQIGSKGGGASTQRPGAGVGPAKASSIKAPTTKLQSFTAGSNLAANRQTAMGQMGKGTTAAPKPSVGQGFIKSQTQGLKNPTGGALQAPNRTAPSTGRAPASQPTVRAGTSYTNPAGVPASVAKALAARGFNPDGTRMQPGMISRNPFDRTKEVQQERARLNDQRGVIARNPFDVTQDVQRQRAIANDDRRVIARNPYDVTREVQQQRARMNDDRAVIARNPFDVSREVNQQRTAAGIRNPSQPPPAAPTRGLIGNTIDGLTRDLGRLRDTFIGALPSSPIPGTMTRNVPGLAYQDNGITGPLMGMQPTGPTVQQAIAGGTVDYGGPRVGTVPPGNFRDARTPQTEMNAAALGAVMDRTRAMMQPADRAPSVPGMPAPTGQAGIAAPVAAPRPTPRPADLRGPAAAPPRPTPRPADLRGPVPAGMPYPGADGVTGDDIGGVFGDGQSIEPMGGVVDARSYPFSNFANDGLPPGYRARYLDGQAGSVSPSQGDSVAPSQDDRRPQTVGEAVQRFRYDRDNAKQAASDLPGRVLQAILGGDMSNPDGFGNFPAMTGQRNPTDPRLPWMGGVTTGLTREQLLALVAQMQQPGATPSGSQSQMDLITSTFV